ncbi:GNAT family N-acetyltransferase [Pandoraea fibrosis]|uniref:Acetyltransferase n=1 Tax=Pandoraea fibrosis TaxID=1891094 RepID=A0A5E4TJL5_9BURK|nr:GNAT family N-acetyltransferase [Pandoraea fibrosis]VVD87283.1 acetyltransferase [Pandoraea fibrosis]
MPLRPDDIHIESERLSIRPFSVDDADAAFRCITPSLTRFMSWDPPANREAFDRVWQRWLLTNAEGTDFTFAVRQRTNGNFLGLAGLHEARSLSPELGIWIREDFHTQGFGREAVGLVAMWASTGLGCESFIYPVAEDNHASRRIAESLGGVVVERRETPKFVSVIYRIPKQSTRND